MEKTPSCKYFRLMADEYIEGELTAAEMRDLEAHLAECEECRKEFEELRALKEVLRSAKEETPAGLHSRIMESIGSEPKQKLRRKAAFFRSAAISVACLMLCLSLSVFIATIPMWRGNTGGNADLPEDPIYASGGSTTEECGTMLKNESVSSTPADENIEAEGTSVSEEMQAPEAEAGETDAVPEATAVPETEVVAEMVPSTEAASTVTPETTKQYFKGETNSDADKSVSDGNGAHGMEAPQAEASKVPGGDEITLALLIVSGLLAIASFIAFLISLSSIRNKPTNKGDQK